MATAAELAAAVRVLERASQCSASASLAGLSLGAGNSGAAGARRACAHCAAVSPDRAPWATCGGCRGLFYCSVAHQRLHWRAGHAAECRVLQARARARARAAAESGSSTAAAAAAGELPSDVLHGVLALLPLDSRAAAACVCRAWRAAAADARLWATLDVRGCEPRLLSDATLRWLCLLSGDDLRCLDLRAYTKAPNRYGQGPGLTHRGLAAALRTRAGGAVSQLLTPPMDSCPIALWLRAPTAAALALLGGSSLRRVSCVLFDSDDDPEAYDDDNDDDDLYGGSPAAVHPHETLAAALTCLPRGGDSHIEVHMESVTKPGVWRSLLAAVARGGSVAALRLFRARVPDAATLPALGAALSGNESLRVLALGCVEYTAGNGPAALCAALCAALRAPRCALATLQLGGDRLGPDGAAALAAALQHGGAPSLRRLDLGCSQRCEHGNDIGDDGAAALAAALATNATLTSLNLACCGVGDAGAAALAAALEPGANAALRELGLHGNPRGLLEGVPGRFATPVMAALRRVAKARTPRLRFEGEGLDDEVRRRRMNKNLERMFEFERGPVWGKAGSDDDDD